MDAPTPTELLNEAAKLLGASERLDHNSGNLVRERFIAAILLELAKRSFDPLSQIPKETWSDLPSEVNAAARTALRTKLTLPRKK